jgi:hypothetical protein
MKKVSKSGCCALQAQGALVIMYIICKYVSKEDWLGVLSDDGSLIPKNKHEK